MLTQKRPTVIPQLPSNSLWHKIEILAEYATFSGINNRNRSRKYLVKNRQMNFWHLKIFEGKENNFKLAIIFVTFDIFARWVLERLQGIWCFHFALLCVSNSNVSPHAWSMESLPPSSTENDSAKGNMVFLGYLREREVSSMFILLKSKLSVTNIFLPLELKLLRFNLFC